jgi:hypothetical protein
MGRRGRGKETRRIVAIALASIAVPAVAAEARPQPADGPLVRVATTGNGSERIKTLPVTREPGRAKRVVMSMSPRTLPDLERGDLVRVSAEFQVTGDCGHRNPRCIQRVYHYAPKISGRLILASRPDATGGPRTMPLAPVKREGCSQRRPDYEHHCVIAFTRAGFQVGGGLPCARDACYVNFVAGASSPRARREDVVAVGGLRPDGSIPQDRGRINAIRYRGANPDGFQRVTAREPHRRRLPPNLERRVVYSAPLTALEDGEQIAVSATLRTDVSHLRYAVRTSARLILADSPRATRQSAFVKRVAVGQGEISENNGSNCTQDEGTCLARKVGVAELRRDAVRGGRPARLYINLVTVLGPKVKKARPDDRVVIRRGGIGVTRFPSRVNG